MKHLFALALLAGAVAPAAGQLGIPVPVGPFGGETLAVDVDPANPSTVLVSTYQDGLLRSTNGGLVFAPHPTIGLPVGGGQYASLLERNPNQPSELIAAVGTSLYTSTDGTVWTDRNVAANGDVRWVTIQTGGNVWLAGTGSEVRRSDDGGFSWNTAHTGLILGQVAFAPSDPSRAYLATFNGLFASTDAGQSFAQVGTFSSWLKAVAVSPTDADTVFAAGTGGTVKKSTNGGLTWTDTSLGGFASMEFFEWDLAASPPRLWGGRLTGLVYTQDLGATWIPANTGLLPTDPITEGLAFAPNGDHYLATGDGFYKAIGAPQPWNLIGLPNLDVFDVAVAGDGKRVAVTSRGAYVSPSLGQPFVQSGWVFDFGAHTNTLVIDPNDSDRWILGGVGAFIDNATVRVATNDGVDIATPLEIFGAGQVLALERDPVGGTAMLAGLFPASFGQIGIARSTDLGATWTPVAASVGWATTAIAYDPATPGRALALQGLTGQIRVSTDGGQTWPTTLAGWATSPAWLLEADPLRPGVFYGGDEGAGLHVSTNGGANWTPLGESCHQRSRIAFHPSLPGHFWYADAQGRVRVTTDGGATFATAYTNAGGVNGVALDPATGNVLVGTVTSSVIELFAASPYIDLGGASAGAGGIAPRQVAKGPLAQVGNGAWVLGADRVVGGAPVLMHLGLSNPQIPFAGGVLGTFLPTIVQPIAIASGVPGVPGDGAVDFALPIPPLPSLAGVPLYAQSFSLDVAAIDSIALSNALQIVILP